MWSRHIGFTNTKIKDCLISSAVKLGAGTFDNAWGNGRVNAEAALRCGDVVVLPSVVGPGCLPSRIWCSADGPVQCPTITRCAARRGSSCSARRSCPETCPTQVPALCRTQVPEQCPTQVPGACPSSSRPVPVAGPGAVPVARADPVPGVARAPECPSRLPVLCPTTHRPGDLRAGTRDPGAVPRPVVDPGDVPDPDPGPPDPGPGPAGGRGRAVRAVVRRGRVVRGRRRGRGAAVPGPGVGRRDARDARSGTGSTTRAGRTIGPAVGRGRSGPAAIAQLRAAGLLTAREIVEHGVRVLDRSRSHAVRLVEVGGRPAYAVKALARATGGTDVQGSPERELAAYALARSDPALEPLLARSQPAPTARRADPRGGRRRDRGGARRPTPRALRALAATLAAWHAGTRAACRSRRCGRGRSTCSPASRPPSWRATTACARCSPGCRSARCWPRRSPRPARAGRRSRSSTATRGSTTGCSTRTGGATLIDWETSGRGDPAWDVAAVLQDVITLSGAERLADVPAARVRPRSWTPTREASGDDVRERLAGCCARGCCSARCRRRRGIRRGRCRRRGATRGSPPSWPAGRRRGHDGGRAAARGRARGPGLARAPARGRRRRRSPTPSTPAGTCSSRRAAAVRAAAAGRARRGRGPARRARRERPLRARLAGARRVSTHGRAEAVRGELTRVVDRGDYLVPARPGLRAEPGDELALLAREDTVENGFWMTFFGDWERAAKEVVTRLYWRVSAAGGARAGARAHRPAARRRGVRRRSRRRSAADGFARADAVVVYLPPRDVHGARRTGSPRSRRCWTASCATRRRGWRAGSRAASARPRAARAPRASASRAAGWSRRRSRGRAASRPWSGSARSFAARRARSRPPAPRAWEPRALCLVTTERLLEAARALGDAARARRGVVGRALHLARRRRRAGRGRLARRAPLLRRRPLRGHERRRRVPRPPRRAHRRRRPRRGGAGRAAPGAGRRRRRPLALRRSDGRSRGRRPRRGARPATTSWSSTRRR